MDIIYPYNETLPKRTAHDVYIFRNCASLSQQQLHVGLCCGWGSLGDDMLFQHYKMTDPLNLTVQRLPILRRMGPLSLNRIFFWNTQRYIAQRQPRWVLTSVSKQAAYHIERRLPGVRYGYEVHQLGWYPNSDNANSRRAALWERSILEKMDLVTVTTHALRHILRHAPYSLTNAIEVVPLAVDALAVETPLPSGSFTIMYVGQLYESQGLRLLLDALSLTQGIGLQIIGGTPDEVTALKHYAMQKGILGRIVFHGFVPPASLQIYVQHAHAFVAPFLAVERMPYVAHTKLYEYASWRRPIIAPALDVVKEHLAGCDSRLLFTPGDAVSLAQALENAKQNVRACPAVNHSWAQRSMTYKSLLT